MCICVCIYKICMCNDVRRDPCMYGWACWYVSGHWNMIIMYVCIFIHIIQIIYIFAPIM